MDIEHNSNEWFPVSTEHLSDHGMMEVPATSPLHIELNVLLRAIENLNTLRPNDLQDVFTLARKLGIDVARHPSVKRALRHLMQNFIQRKQKYEHSSLHRLNNAWIVFSRWCYTHGHTPLPASTDTVERYFSDRFGVEERHRNTVRMDAWMISIIHNAAGALDPVKDEYVKDHLDSLVKEAVRNDQFIKQAVPFNERHLDRLIERWRDSGDLLLRRNLALLAVAYESMLRAQELANIKLSHLTIHDDGHATLLIPVTKTNHSGEPNDAYLSADTVDMIFEYLSLGKTELTEGGYLFFGITKHGTRIKPKKVDGEIRHSKLSTRTIVNVFDLAWRELGLDKRSHRPFSGHSARVGACQDLLRAGYTIPQIQQSGRWADPQMIYRYGRDIMAEQSAMAMARKSRQRKK